MVRQKARILRRAGAVYLSPDADVSKFGNYDSILSEEEELTSAIESITPRV